MGAKNICFHCGEKCDGSIQANERCFCCSGCKQVYFLLNENELCQFYELGVNPGISAKGKFTDKKFSYLDDPAIVHQLAHFVSKDKVNISFFLPQMHCSSCVFLLEKLDRINKGINRSSVDFTKKTIFVSYDPKQLGLKDLVQLLAFIGYEPELTLHDSVAIRPINKNRKSILQIGVAGFCFGNIMMLSFPDYFSQGELGISGLNQLFSLLIFLLSLPVIFFSAVPIFSSAYKSLRQGEINIDVPIALASIITFGRSYFDILTGAGSGYLDSGTGIIFFMLIGRWFQDKTYDALTFDRKFKSYFPLGVSILKEGHQEMSIPMSQLKVGDTVLTRNEELIPADSVLQSESASIDYSFVTGENDCVTVKEGEVIFAGGKLLGSSILSETVKLPSQSYITELWNNSIFHKNKENQASFVHPWSRYFTLVLFSIACISGLYWFMVDASKVWLVITSVLIVACPCSLLLSATFTYGNMLRVFGKNKLFLKNAHVIESLSGITDIVFDKTGTITEQSVSAVTYHGNPMQENEKILVRQIASNSGHVLSRGIFSHLQSEGDNYLQTEHFSEVKGRGMEGVFSGQHVRMGNASFVLSDASTELNESSLVHVQIDENYKGYYKVSHRYRLGLADMIHSLKGKYNLHLLSGDCDAEREKIVSLFGQESGIRFSVLPQDKLDYIKKLQDQGKKVLMVGDGLNDAGALMQAHVGLAVSEKQAHFTPASDGIIDGTAVVQLPEFLSYARAGKDMVSIGFIVSLMYNIIGVGLAVQGLLSPVFAAILMPLSSITIVTLAIALSSIRGTMRLKAKNNNLIIKENPTA